MKIVRERAKDVLLVAQCAIDANAGLRHLVIAGQPTLYVSYKSPLWLVPLADAGDKNDVKYHLFYYSNSGYICLRRIYGDVPPVYWYTGRVFPFQEGKTFNTYHNICSMHSDQDGQYVDIRYKLAILNEDEARKEFKSEYYSDRKLALQSIKLIEIHDCILRWVATFKTSHGEVVKASIDPLGHFFASSLHGVVTNFYGKTPKENKDYFSLDDVHKTPFRGNYVTMRYHDGSIEILNFGSAEKMPPSGAFKDIEVFEYS